MLDDAEIIAAARMLIAARHAEREKLDKIHEYLHGTQDHPISITRGIPTEVKDLAKMSRVNVIRLPVDVLAQSLFVDGYRQPTELDMNEPTWEAWQANRLDARQAPVHRAALGYGVSYVVVTDGSPYPVARGVSPRKLTALYGDDPDWPELAIEERGQERYRIYDADGIYEVSEVEAEFGQPPAFEVTAVSPHRYGVTPVVRFVNLDDLEGVPVGEVEPLIPLQDQIDHTTFDLLVAQHYGAFRQRYVMGWVAEDETTKLQASAARLWNFEDPDVKVGEFEQTELAGYLESREATFRHMAIISQVPPHAMLGQMANLAADAIVAANMGKQSKVVERQTSFGESWEQVHQLLAIGMGTEVSDAAEVRWRDSEPRSLSQVADALGKLAENVGVPVEMLWEMIPGWSQATVSRARSLASEGDALAQLADRLLRQNDGDPSMV